VATFWIIATLLILLALLFVIPPLLKQTFAVNQTDRNAINLKIYKERLAELTQEQLPPEQFAETKQELDKILAQDLPDQVELTQRPRAIWVSVIVVALFIPIFSTVLYGYFGRPDHLTPPLSEAVPSLPANFDEMVAKLAARLEKEPHDLKGWRMLAHSYVALERYSEAAKAYEKLLVLENQQNPETLVDYAEVLALLHQGQFNQEGLTLLQSALKIEPNHQQALWLLGLASVQTMDYHSTIGYWERLQTLLPAEAEKAKQQLQEQLSKVKQLAQQNSQEQTEK
jgi:cytochrome c-type biogenesis protein CcmH